VDEQERGRLQRKTERPKYVGLPLKKAEEMAARDAEVLRVRVFQKGPPMVLSAEGSPGRLNLWVDEGIVMRATFE